MKTSFLEIEANLGAVAPSLFNKSLRRQSILERIQRLDNLLDICSSTLICSNYFLTKSKLLLINELEQLL